MTLNYQKMAICLPHPSFGFIDQIQDVPLSEGDQCQGTLNTPVGNLCDTHESPNQRDSTRYHLIDDFSGGIEGDTMLVAHWSSRMILA
jgi:hypothetical protein